MADNVGNVKRIVLFENLEVDQNTTVPSRIISIRDGNFYGNMSLQFKKTGVGSGKFTIRQSNEYTEGVEDGAFIAPNIDPDIVTIAAGAQNGLVEVNMVISEAFIIDFQEDNVGICVISAWLSAQ